ncbi:uncharacterized protein LOC130911246 [Corythoichthys intestinalis]|uniref:uncharacterized protein LOC130911246 n=1 Tax=Corythoichthys intestinalis TaxID=161448 RepID=UPI0025A5D48A|nr:uncharacterized protein LOC130911246 [Corythoichthys intestinalis]
MRLTWSAMLQHNNNNNYPCLKASPHEAPLMSASQPIPSRLELGLGDLPLIRGLRAWVLCSKNRQKGGAPPAGRRAPVTPPASRRTYCPRPADVHLSGTWGSGYGLPHAGVGALVTVATLKTSEGTGKTQTQCLFLRNDKGTCLYSTSGGTSGAGAWLRGKSGTSRRDISTLQMQTAASRVRLRSGRRWRKSGHPVVREKRQSDEDVAQEHEKQGASHKGETCQKHRGSQDTSGGLQNPSDVESLSNSSHANKTLPHEEAIVKLEEPDKVCLDCLNRSDGESCQKSPGFSQNAYRENCQNKSSHTAGPVTILPEKDVTENQSKKVDPQLFGSPDKAVCQKTCVLVRNPGCFQNALNEGSQQESSHALDQDKTLPDEKATVKEEESDKVSPECLDSPERESCPKSQEFGQKKNQYNIRIPEEEVTEKQQDLQIFSSPDMELCKKTRGLVRSLQNASNKGSQRRSSYAPGQNKRLPYEEGTEKQEKPGKVSSECLACSEERMCQQSRGLLGSPGCLQNVSNEASSIGQSPSSGEMSGMKREWEENAFHRNTLSSSVGPSPDLESSHSASECEGSKESKSTKKRMGEDDGVIQTPFDDITLTTVCTKASSPARGSTGRAESKLCQVENREAHPELEQNASNPTLDSSLSSSKESFKINFMEGKEADWTPKEFARGCMVTPGGPRLQIPTPYLPPLGTMETSQQHAEVEEENRGPDEIALESWGEKQQEEDDFGGFMQAGEGCSQGVAVYDPAAELMQQRSRQNQRALGSSDISGKSCDWKPTWTGSLDAWATFPQDVWDEGRDSAGQWWPEEETSDDNTVNHELACLFAVAFPTPATSAPQHPDDVIPTLMQLLQERGQEQRLLDGFQDVSKMSIPRYKQGGGVSRGLLLTSLHVERPNTDSQSTNCRSYCRPFPGLYSPNQRVPNTVVKRRLSCDYNRSGPE